jgi:hypothetical protein
VAFLRFSRDRRGYEHFYLVQPPSRGKGRPRVLYCFRTPPNIRVGRAPFDPEIQRALESQNPDVAFDWTAIERTPIPPPETEHWRERRRADRALRAAAEAEQAPAIADVSDIEPVSEDITSEPPEAISAISSGEPDIVPPAGMALEASEASGVERGPGRGESSRRRRRRRRRKPQNPAVREGPEVQEGPQVSTAAEPEDGV